MKCYARVVVPIPGYTTLDSLDELVEKVRETASPTLSPDGRRLTIEWEADNEWDLRGIAQSTVDEVGSVWGLRDLDIALDAAERWQAEDK